MQRARGFTLMEALIVVGVGAVLAATAMAYFAPAKADAKAAVFSENIGVTVARIRDRYKTAIDYSGLTTVYVIGEQLAPPDLIVGPFLRSPWGGNITVQANDFAGEGQMGGFLITIVGPIPAPACRDVVPTFAANAVAITVGSTVYSDMSPTGQNAIGTAICAATGATNIMLATR